MDRTSLRRSRAGSSRAPRPQRARVLALLLTALLVPAVALADEPRTFEVTGESDAGASDPRAVAVDDAFAQATRDALDDLLSRAQRAEHKAVLAKEIIGRARRWVASYKVTGDATDGGKRKLQVTVRINLEALRTRLIELSVLTEEPSSVDPSAPPTTSPGAPVAEPARGDPRWAGRTATLLLRSKRGERAVATFGALADRAVPGATAAAEVLVERGLVVRPAALAGPAPRSSGELPLGDDQARALAAESRAELAVIVGAEVGERARLRGVLLPMLLARASARVVADGKDGAQGEGSGVAVAPVGEDERSAAASALDRAVSAAVASALPTQVAAHAAAEITHDDASPPSVEGAVWLRLAPRTPWKVVGAVLRHLGKQAGTSAELRRLSPAGYLVLVKTGGSADRVAAAARAAALPAGSGELKVRSERGLVTVRIEAP